MFMGSNTDKLKRSIEHKRVKLDQTLRGPDTMKAIALENDFITCEMDLLHGARITTLKYKGQEVIEPAKFKDTSKASNIGLLAMIPCLHHTSLAELKWSGTSHPHLNPLEHDSELHWGVGWQSPWQILEQEQDHVLLSLEHRAEKNWPWLFDASQTIHLLAGELCLSLSMTNQSRVPSPCGLGWAMSLPMDAMGGLTLKAQEPYQWHRPQMKSMNNEHPWREAALKPQELKLNAQELNEGWGFGQWDGVLRVNSHKHQIELNSKLKTVQAKTNLDANQVMIKVSDQPMEVLQQTRPPQMLLPGESISVQMSLIFNASE